MVRNWKKFKNNFKIVLFWRRKMQFWQKFRKISLKTRSYSALSPEMLLKHGLFGNFFFSSKWLFVRIEGNFDNRAVNFHSKLGNFLQKSMKNANICQFCKNHPLLKTFFRTRRMQFFRPWKKIALKDQILFQSKSQNDFKKK